MIRISVAQLIVTAALIVSPLGVAAQGTANQQPAANSTAADTAKPAAGDEQKICKQLPSSSSRLPQRVCLTKKQWDQVDNDDR